jgi:uncharacterized protein (TIGR02300 family)
MPRDLGTKYTCFKCGTKFYDLKRPVPACPKCGADQREAPTPKPVSSRQRAVPPPRAVDEELPLEEAEEAEAEEEEDVPDEDEP